jgi:hypothetical protein
VTKDFGMKKKPGQKWKWIPMKLSPAQFEQFVLSHLLTGGRGTALELSPAAVTRKSKATRLLPSVTLTSI